MPAPLRIVIVGFGPVASRLVDELHPAAASGIVDVTVVGAEPADAYNRVLVAEYAVGNAELASMLVADRARAERVGIRLLKGTVVATIDREHRHVVLEHGERLPFDRLVLATGSRANIPTLDGIERHRRDLPALEKYAHTLVGRDDALPNGVTTLRDLSDAERVMGAVRARSRIVVLGAGVLGLEIALAAAHAGAAVCVVHHGPHPMPRNLDRGAGLVLRAALRHSGITVIANSRAEAVGFRTNDVGEREFDFLATADGKTIQGDLLLLSCGVSPRTELAVLAGLRTAVGIVVDEGLASWTDPAIFAIGDCAQVTTRTPELEHARELPGTPSGLIAPGWRQAEYLAARLASDARGGVTVRATPAERQPLVMLKAEHIDVVAVGEVAIEPWDELDTSTRRVAQWADPEHFRYVKMVTERGVLTGFVCVGMPRTAAELTLMFERGDELPADRSMLLRFDGPDYDPAADADAFAPETTICWCNGVTVQRIEAAATATCADPTIDGGASIESIGCDTRAGTGCGGCTGRIGEVLARFAETGGAAAITS